jgi:hypothetical protein
MKIAVVTFHRAPNYGAMLQSFALERSLKSRGHEVAFVNQTRFVSWNFSLPDCFISRSVHNMRYKLSVHVRQPMAAFSDGRPQTVPCRTFDDVRRATADCEAFIVGSDQVWNSIWWKTDDDLRIAMLDFAPEGRPRLSYAVSFGNREWPTPENARRVGDSLKKFTKLSVREQSGVELVRALSGRADAVCLLDPTLLHTADFWRSVIAGASVRRRANAAGPYVFKYVLQWEAAEVSDRALKAVLGQLGIARVEDVHVPVRGFLAPVCRLLNVTAKLTVPEWLAGVADADFVFTDSFHGTVFSILFHRPFVALLLRGEMSGMNERILSLLDILGLSDRAVYADEVESWLPRIVAPIDWDDVDGRLAVCRLRSVEFLSGLDHVATHER